MSEHTSEKEQNERQWRAEETVSPTDMKLSHVAINTTCRSLLQRLWIKTIPPTGFVVSHPSRVRGLKLTGRKPQKKVASLVDAWIKINHIEYTNDSILSHPSRMRGLKQGNGSVGGTEERHIPRGCVD